MKAYYIHSNKHGNGSTTVAAILALIEAKAFGRRVALVSNSGDAAATLGAPAGNTHQEITQGLDLYEVEPHAVGWTDAQAIAALVGISDEHAPDVVVVDLGNMGERFALDLASAGFDVLDVLVTRNHYVELRRDTQANAKPHHLVVVTDAGAALTTNDVGMVLKPTGQMFTLDRTDALARTLDAGLLVHRAGTRDTFDTLAAIVEAAPTHEAHARISDATHVEADREPVELKAKRKRTATK